MNSHEKKSLWLWKLYWHKTHFGMRKYCWVTQRPHPLLYFLCSVVICTVKDHIFYTEHGIAAMCKSEMYFCLILSLQTICETLENQKSVVDKLAADTQVLEKHISSEKSKLYKQEFKCLQGYRDKLNMKVSKDVHLLEEIISKLRIFEVNIWPRLCGSVILLRGQNTTKLGHQSKSRRKWIQTVLEVPLWRGLGSQGLCLLLMGNLVWAHNILN